MCKHKLLSLLTVFEFNTKNDNGWARLRVHLRRRVIGGFWEVQQTCSWVYLIFKRTHLTWHVGLPLTLRKGRFNSQWCLQLFKFLTADSWKKVSLFSNITKKVSTKTSKTVVDLVMHNGEAVGASKPIKPTNAPSERHQASLCNIYVQNHRLLSKTDTSGGPGERDTCNIYAQLYLK